MRKTEKKDHKKEITGICNYEILSNHDYAMSFGYTSIEMRQHDIEFELSD